ncbi:DUF742 domain-containing protein [Dactylosporangium matsuzakiense]|uniref:DUF742 domain-containing protein n=1 Tax=Dactylosporangium matsuzakiense TaxID=53360 RepID=A0A9W6NPM7_9ACTN|nr:DUF742 domain-containing protein [Dactylosporangium matsuzakiense]UWZ47499.1 DUF742 domain-containing protein [Dactylosporangium matsuzakiense]GLL05260.1 hypothetical protein GCM10017581_070070 [Dactylosporangium matsuzakiense]
MSPEPYAAPEPESVGRIPPYLRTPSAGPAPGGPPGAEEPPAPTAGGTAALRPFVLTSGRVEAADREIGLETQVTLRGDAVPSGGLPPEMQAIVRLCERPISVAELSALVPLHLGVTRILVADLRVAGYLDVHVTDTDNSQSPETILRVMRGLRAIR